MPMIKVDARGESFKLLQVRGNLFVCAEENGGCCCGHTEKGRARDNKNLYGEQWDSRMMRNKVHLTFVGCLGPCPVGNNAMLQLHGRSIWFKDLNDDALIPQLFDYIDAMLEAGRVLAPPKALAAHVYERYVETDAGAAVIPLAEVVLAENGFEGIDPVCMMRVDPATARHSSVYQGVTYHFCAPGCKRSFERDPAAYVKAK